MKSVMYIICEMAIVEGAIVVSSVRYTFWNDPKPREVLKRFAERDPNTRYALFKMECVGNSISVPNEYREIDDFASIAKW